MLTLPRLRMRRLLRRRRRPIAALLAGVATLLALMTLRPVPAPATGAPAVDPTQPMAGEVVVPVALSNAAGGSLDLGDVVDLVRVDDAGAAVVIATGARVVELPTGRSPLGSSAAAVALVAVREAQGLDVAAAGSVGGLTFLRRPAG